MCPGPLSALPIDLLGAYSGSVFDPYENGRAGLAIKQLILFREALCYSCVVS